MEKISWTDHVRNGALHRVKQAKNTLCTIKRSNTNRIGQILRSTYHLKHVTEGKIEEKSDEMMRKKT